MDIKAKLDSAAEARQAEFDIARQQADAEHRVQLTRALAGAFANLYRHLAADPPALTEDCNFYNLRTPWARVDGGYKHDVDDRWVAAHVDGITIAISADPITRKIAFIKKCSRCDDFMPVVVVGNASGWFWVDAWMVTAHPDSVPCDEAF